MNFALTQYLFIFDQEAANRSRHAVVVMSAIKKLRTKLQAEGVEKKVIRNLKFEIIKVALLFLVCCFLFQ